MCRFFNQKKNILKAKDLFQLFQNHPIVDEIVEQCEKDDKCKIKLENGLGSSVAFVASVLISRKDWKHVFVLNDREEAA